MVIVTPGPAGVPDTGVVVGILQPLVTAGGLPLAVTGSITAMVNSVTGIPYPLVIGPLASTDVSVGGMALVRAGDQIPSPPGILSILGPPPAPFITDGGPP
jgi:hypothetical protein